MATSLGREIGFCDEFAELAAKERDSSLRVVLKTVSFEHLQNPPPDVFGFRGAVNVVVCAWSLNYVMIANWGETKWHATMNATLEGIYSLLDRSRPSFVVVVETLGNGTEVPTRKSTYTAFLIENEVSIVYTEYDVDNPDLIEMRDNVYRLDLLPKNYPRYNV